MRRERQLGIVGVAALAGVMALSAASSAHAQVRPERWAPEDYQIASPMRFAWEFRAGFYEPEATNVGDSAFGFGGDTGPLIGTELDVLIYRIPYVGHVAGGAAFSWAKYTGKAIDQTSGMASDEGSKLTTFPVSTLAVLRIDVLERQFDIPFLITGKVGLDIIPWKAQTGGSTEGKDVALGFHWAAQVALELDFLEPRSARALDQNWGINHTFAYVEVWGTTAKSSGGGAPDVSLQDTTWAAGLGAYF